MDLVLATRLLNLVYQSGKSQYLDTDQYQETPYEILVYSRRFGVLANNVIDATIMFTIMRLIIDEKFSHRLDLSSLMRETFIEMQENGDIDGLAADIIDLSDDDLYTLMVSMCGNYINQVHYYEESPDEFETYTLFPEIRPYFYSLGEVRSKWSKYLQDKK